MANRFDDLIKELGLPVRREVCPRCNGTGKHVNPAIDSHGISQEEFDQDPDFEEAYHSGRYDVRCEECGGNNVITVVDRKAAKASNPEALEEYDEYVRSARETDAIYEAERRMGA